MESFVVEQPGEAGGDGGEKQEQERVARDAEQIGCVALHQDDAPGEEDNDRGSESDGEIGIDALDTDLTEDGG